MKNRYRKFRRGKIWWSHDSQTGKQSTLKTKSKTDAFRILDVMNQPYQSADFHLDMARTHLKQGDVKRVTRTWQHVLDAICDARTGNTRLDTNHNGWLDASELIYFDANKNKILNRKSRLELKLPSIYWRKSS